MNNNWMNETMLAERLIGVITYSIILFFVYVSLKNAKKYKQLQRILNIYLIVICILAFFYIPAKTADLTRWLEYSEKWRLMPFKEFYELHLEKNNVPVAYLLMYLCSLTGIDGTLPAICALIFFNNVFYILKDLYKKHNVSANGIASALLFIMSTGCFLEVISGVRCFVALSILARCFYNETINNKSIINNIIFCVIASLLHPMALIIYTIRLFLLLVQKSNSFIKKTFSICFVLIFCVLFFEYASPYIDTALDKASDYTSSNTAYSFIWEYIIGILSSIVYITVLYKYKKTKNSTEFDNIVIFNIVFLIICLVFSFEYNIFHRTITFLSIINTPIISKSYDLAKNKNLYRFLTFFSCLILLLACTRGNLCGYKFLLFS